MKPIVVRISEEGVEIELLLSSDKKQVIHLPADQEACIEVIGKRGETWETLSYLPKGD